MQCTAAASRAGLVILLALVQTGAGIDPELKPVSHDKFFKADNPDDYRPTYPSTFGHPYPEIQDDDKYDSDYVMDKNQDNGYWKVQMAYDEARVRLSRETQHLKIAQSKEAEEKMELDKAKSDEAVKAAETNEAKSLGEDASNVERSADEEHEATEEDLEAATKEVEKEMSDLEECKKQLAEAKKRLELILEKKKAAEAKKNDASAQKEEVKKAEAVAVNNEKELEKNVEEEEKEHQAAVSAVATEESEVKKAEEDLKANAEKLKHFRKADANGGVTCKGECPKSGSERAAFPALLAAMAVMLSLL